MQFKNIKDTVTSIKGVKQSITTSYTYNHKMMIVCLSLMTVIGVQNFSHLLPTVSFPVNEVHASNDRPEVIQCNRDCLDRAYLLLRTDEIHETLRGTARLMALQEMQDSVIDMTHNP